MAFYLLTFFVLSTYLLYSVQGKLEEANAKRNGHVGSDSGTRLLDPLSFSIIGGEGDFLPGPPHAGEPQEAARCLPKHAAYVGRRRQG